MPYNPLAQFGIANRSYGYCQVIEWGYPWACAGGARSVRWFVLHGCPVFVALMHAGVGGKIDF
jgi:hypothetical protein